MSAPLDGPNRDPWPEALWDHPEPDIDDTVNLGDEGLEEGDDISPYFDSYFADNTRVEIPAGTYDLADRGALGADYDDLHVKGMGGLGGVVLDQGSGQTSGPTMETDTIQVWEDIDIVGQIDGDANSRIRIRATDLADSEVVWKRVRLRDGELDGSGDGTQGIYIDSSRGSVGCGGHEGTLRLLWSEISGFGDNGGYLDGPVEGSCSGGNPEAGQVIIVGGLYRNSNISNLRLGAGPYSTIYRTVCLLDDDKIDHGDTENFRGIRIRQPADDPIAGLEYDYLIADCDISYETNSSGGSPIDFSSSLDFDAATGEIHDTRIYNEGGANAIGGTSGADGPWEAYNVHITGSDDGSILTLQDSPSPNSDEAESPNTDPWWGIEAEDAEAEDEEEEESGDESGDEEPGVELDVVTAEATEVETSDALLNAEVVDMGGYDEVDVWFEWREEAESEWDETTAQRMNGTETYNETLADLDPETTYEFRAAATGVDNS